MKALGCKVKELAQLLVLYLLLGKNLERYLVCHLLLQQADLLEQKSKDFLVVKMN